MNKIENYFNELLLLSGQYIEDENKAQILFDKIVKLKDSVCNTTESTLAEEFQKFNNERINHPRHYSWLKDLCGIEVIDIARHLDFCTGNALKYLLRAGHKSEEGYSDKEKTIEDLRKAIFYINDKIKMLENVR